VWLGAVLVAALILEEVMARLNDINPMMKSSILDFSRRPTYIIFAIDRSARRAFAGTLQPEE
jgi:hypothetical protein